MNLTRLRDRSIKLLKRAVLGLIAKSGYKLSKVSSPSPSRVNLEKKKLIDYTFSKCQPRPTSFADLGGVWNVDGVYTFYALENHRLQSAFLADGRFTAEVVDKAAGHSQLQLLKGNFGTESIATRVRGVDAIFLFDVLLHQVNPDWDQILEKYAGTAKYLLVFNQQWTGEKTVRLLDWDGTNTSGTRRTSPLIPLFKQCSRKCTNVTPGTTGLGGIFTTFGSGGSQTPI